MFPRGLAIAAWIGGTLVSVLLAASAVGSVRGEVTDVPGIDAAASLAASLNGTSTTIDGITSTTTDGAGPGTSVTPPPDDQSGGTTTATTTPQTTTTSPKATTTSAEEPARSTYRLVGGQVTITALDPTVSLIAAVPAPGFSVEFDHLGPGEVRVEFESETHRSSFRARWENGELDIEIDEDADEG